MKTLQEYIKEGDSKEKSIRNYWTDIAKKHLVGKKIVAVEYMWYKKPIAICLDNKHWLIPVMDDEGNDGGAISTTISELKTIPVI